MPGSQSHYTSLFTTISGLIGGLGKAITYKPMLASITLSGLTTVATYAAVQRESNNTITSEPPITPTTPITTMENNNKPGLLSWVQANPLPSLAIAGAVGLILYKSLVVFILSLALTWALPQSPPSAGFAGWLLAAIGGSALMAEFYYMF